MKNQPTWYDLIKIPVVKYGFKQIERLGLHPKHKFLFGLFDIVNMVAFAVSTIWFVNHYKLAESTTNIIFFVSILLFALIWRPLLNLLFLKIFSR